MKSLASVLAALLACSFTTAAMAADLFRPAPPMPMMVSAAADPSYYIALRGGADWASDSRFLAAGSQVASTYESPGYVVSGALGVHLDRVLGEFTGLRGEFEAGQVSSDVESHKVGGTTFRGKQATGTRSTTYAMASLYLDLTRHWMLTPFIGAGAGIAEVEFKNFGTPGTGIVLDDRSTEWIYHATAGVSARLSPRWQLEAAYRYMGVPRATPANVAGERQQIETTNHLLLVGARAHF